VLYENGKFSRIKPNKCEDCCEFLQSKGIILIDSTHFSDLIIFEKANLKTVNEPGCFVRAVYGDSYYEQIPENVRPLVTPAAIVQAICIEKKINLITPGTLYISDSRNFLNRQHIFVIGNHCYQGEFDYNFVKRLNIAYVMHFTKTLAGRREFLVQRYSDYTENSNASYNVNSIYEYIRYHLETERILLDTFDIYLEKKSIALLNKGFTSLAVFDNIKRKFINKKPEYEFTHGYDGKQFVSVNKESKFNYHFETRSRFVYLSEDTQFIFNVELNKLLAFD
jgi:hypothetical protein